MNVKKGAIVGFHGSWMSGLADIVFKSPEGLIDHVSCDNAPTVRALEACFGDTIGEGHRMKSNPGFLFKEVYYCTDSIGLLEWFTPVEDAHPDVIKAYLKNKQLIQSIN